MKPGTQATSKLSTEEMKMAEHATRDPDPLLVPAPSEPFRPAAIQMERAIQEQEQALDSYSNVHLQP